MMVFKHTIYHAKPWLLAVSLTQPFRPSRGLQALGKGKGVSCVWTNDLPLELYPASPLSTPMAQAYLQRWERRPDPAGRDVIPLAN